MAAGLRSSGPHFCLQAFRMMFLIDLSIEPGIPMFLAKAVPPVGRASGLTRWLGRGASGHTTGLTLYRGERVLPAKKNMSGADRFVLDKSSLRRPNRRWRQAMLSKAMDINVNAFSVRTTLRPAKAF